MFEHRTDSLTSTLMLELVGRLNVAFPGRAGERDAAKLAEVYRTGLRGLSGASIREAVDRCIQTEEYFPKVAKIRELASGYEKHRGFAVQGQPDDDGRSCPICGTTVTWEEAYRYTGKRDERTNKPIMEPSGVFRYHWSHDARLHGVVSTPAGALG